MCVGCFWICLYYSDSLLYILFTCEHKDAEYVCWRLSEVWKFWMFLEVASFRNLKSFSRLFLKSSKWKCRSCKSPGIVWCFWKIFQICDWRSVYSSKNFRQHAVFTRSNWRSPNCLCIIATNVSITFM